MTETLVATTPRWSGAVAAGPRGRILVVDDNEANRELLGRRLQRQGHAVTTATNGREALDAARADDFDLVLLDLNMPELNGFEVLERMQADEVLRHVPVIMLSADDDTETVVRGIELGAEDYLAKPFHPALLKARVGASLEKKRLRDRERSHAAALERDLEIGRQIQMGFLPERVPQPPGWEIAARFRAARQVSGDFYDVFPLGTQGRIGLVIADVCDKGVGAALFMALFRTLVRAIAGRQAAHLDAADATGADAAAAACLLATVRATNDYIAETHSRANMFATMVLALLDPASGTLHYVNGGHEAPALVSPDGRVVRLPPTGPAVGMLPDIAFGAARVRMEPGDVLVAFTDGATEARGADDELLGEDRVLALCAEPAASAEALLARLEAAVDVHAGGAPQSDDLTLLAVRRAPAPA